ncbi:Na/Pi cotransporter family protein [Oribacterium sp. oral taxon 108]|uniref:Na/Pi cotransporter family protein n=1 Tax=Oribacterium sp. oral taxon 108 TaxID=712414 RepID=UPI00020DD775|nr:Na/Pi cotransporter family protein [Oribacterium sp. oral taxon 108]EGL37776.1 Na/Pi-cotransporter II-like protein [Oribacterium sp. oral taxon 108 str. F0425]
MSYLSSLFSLFGGLGMFLYGMTVMSDGMQKAASSKMSKFLNIVTENRVMAVILGAGITALVQSSSATTVMVVGFVNAGILNLSQSVGIIMGANIGTTITAWMVSLTQVSGSALSIFKPEFFAPLLVGFGSFRLLFGKKGNDDLLADFCVGVGLIFIGLEFMSSAVSPYANSPIFSKAFQIMGGNPILGILTGAVVTGLIQSSAASVSILQTLALSGAVPRAAGFYITLGQNIGTCVTAMISSAGASRTAKRAAMIHLLFNVTGAVLFGIIIFLMSLPFASFFQGRLSPVEISMFHTIFNISCTIVLYPFADLLVALSGKLVLETKKDKEEAENPNHYTEVEKSLIQHLDLRILESPAIAIAAAKSEVVNMARITEENIHHATDILLEEKTEEIPEIFKQEKVIDNMQKLLTEYLIHIGNLSLNEMQKLEVNNMFNTITDIERAGDHAENIAEQAKFAEEHAISFSEIGQDDIRKISKTVVESFHASIEAFEKNDLDMVVKTAHLEDQVDEMEEDMRETHIERLNSGACAPQAGVVFLDVISDLERISDHADNIAGYVKAMI